MSRTLSFCAAGIATICILGCGYREASPPQAPTAEIPTGLEAATTLPEPGLTRVILDANGDAATVTQIADWSSSVGTVYVGGNSATVEGYRESVRPICIAPCVVDLAPGLYRLRFSSRDDDDDRESVASVQVGAGSKVVRHAMGRVSSTSWVTDVAYLALALGITSAVLGGTLYGASEDGSLHTDLRPTGKALIGGGAAAVLIAIPLFLLDRRVVQRGTTTEFDLK
jgi:hypothetical protein